MTSFLPDLRVQTRWFVIVALIVVISLIVLTIAVSEHTRVVAEAQAMARGHDVAYRTGYELSARINETLGIAHGLAYALEGAMKNRAQINRPALDQLFIQTVHRSDAFVFGAWAVFEPGRFDGQDAQWAGKPEYSPAGDYIPFAYRKEGRIVFKHDSYEADKEQEYYTLPFRARRPCIIPPYVDPDAENAVMSSLAVPVRDGDEVIGVAGVDILLNSFSESCARLKPFGLGYVFLVGNNGVIVGHPHPGKAGRRLDELGVAPHVIEAVRTGVEATERITDPTTHETYTCLYVPVQFSSASPTWSIGVAVPHSVILADSRSLTRMMVVLGSAALLLFGVALLALARSVIAPLRQSETALRRIFDHVADAVVVHDERGDVVVLNKQLLSMLGLEAQQATALNFTRDLAPPGVGLDRLPALWASALRGEPQIFPWQLQPRDAPQRRIEIVVHLTRMVLASRALLVATLHDVTDQRRHERERAAFTQRIESQLRTVSRLTTGSGFWSGSIEQSLRTLCELVADATEVARVSIWMFANSGTELHCRELFERTTRRHSGGTVLYEHQFAAEFSVLRQERFVDAHDARQDPRTAGYTTSYLVPLGITSMLDVGIRVSGQLVGVLCFEHIGPPRHWENDEIIFACTMAEQIGQVLLSHERQQAEIALRETEQRFRAIFSAQPNGIVIVDDEANCILDANPAACQLAGVTTRDLIGRRTDLLLGPPVQRPDAKPTDRTALELTERALHTASGEQLPILTSASRATVAGRPVVIQSFIDLRERKRAEDALLAAVNAEQAANRAKTEFLANMSHEIRTPMNGVLGVLEVLSLEEMSREQRELVETAHNCATALMTLLNDLLDLSKIESGKLETEAVELDPVDLLDDVIALFALGAHDKGIEIIGTADEQVPQHLRGDPVRLRQILSNLIGNAVKFTDRGEIRANITTLRTNEYNVLLNFSITDTGIGIPADKIEQLFNPFVQADGSITRRYGGTGLGLAISRRLVELMGGKIGIDSQAGRGSTFWFQLPFSRSPDPETASSTHELSRQTLLIVDAHPTRRRRLARILTIAGATAIEADAAETAWAVLIAPAGSPVRGVVFSTDNDPTPALHFAERMSTEPRLAPIQVLPITWALSAATPMAAVPANLLTNLRHPVRRRVLVQAVADLIARAGHM